QDPQFRATFLSPLAHDARGWFYFLPNVGLNPAGLAYPVLVVAGLLSFLLCLWAGPWQGWRAPRWGGFLALSLYHYRSIPFFAVVAGPITALNFLDFAAQRFGTALRLDEAWRRWSLGGRAVTAFLLLLLAAAAVPGWLEPFPAQRHLGW